MKITIIGPGNMGRAIATRAVAGGHSVTVVGKTIESAQKVADEVRASAKQGAEVSATTLENVEPGDVVVLALWYGTNIEVAKQLSQKLNGKTVVDIANPLNSTYDGLVTAPDSSSAEDVAK
ncbi:MAG TPA: NAD(P)-binding domain-containing protein, partial [Anaerolineales bacterium]|nr:NAD(P)-binding domain-containing protein [Anaerolineales bacterium]